ncbi:MAG: aspartate-semialdehyde dehydrogenase [bacterium]
MIILDKLVVAVVGATGAVGREMIRVLEQRKFPVKMLVPLATARKENRTVRFRGRALTVRATTDKSFNGVDLTLFAGGSNASQEFGWEAVRRGSLVIDNSSTFRARPDVPLVVPEVNADALRFNHGLVANPNCSTIQMCVVIKPIYKKLGIKRIVVSTYQSVSGKGRDAMEELTKQAKAFLSGKKYAPKVFPHQIAFNVLPHIDVFLENGYTKEEMKMVTETRKIFSNPRLPITATTVRVPVLIGHSESINIETEKPVSIEVVRKLLSQQYGVIVVDDEAPVKDDPLRRTYPLPVDATGRDEVFVGRIRKDISVENGIDLWCVADNLRKGAATNAVQIAELLF